MSSLTLQFFCKLGAAGESNMSAMAKVSEELALVRGLRKVRCVVLWPALAYNLMHFGKVSLTD
jgi:hypothetical protein